MSKKSKSSVIKKTSKSQKSNKFRISPLIAVIALIEVLVLIGVVTYAWFVFAESNTVDSGIITVSPDSGLKIDFADANQNDYINVWNYLKDFSFEPATSVDGRNIFFPTSGTFENDSTNNIRFREGTVNDVNSKYISIDFTLTNTDATATQKIYLDSK